MIPFHLFFWYEDYRTSPFRRGSLEDSCPFHAVNLTFLDFPGSVTGLVRDLIYVLRVRCQVDLMLGCGDFTQSGAPHILEVAEELHHLFAEDRVLAPNVYRLSPRVLRRLSIVGL